MSPLASFNICKTQLTGGSQQVLQVTVPRRTEQVASIRQKIGSRAHSRPASRRGVAKRPPTTENRRSIQKVVDDDVFRPAAAELPAIAEEESPSIGCSTRRLANATIAITTATTSIRRLSD